MHQSLMDSVKCTMVTLPLLRNNTTVLSKFVDMTQYSFAEFHIGVGATDTTTDAKLQESVNADGSSASDVSGGSITQVSSTGDNRLVAISVKKTTLTKRYCGVLVTIGNGITGSNVYVESFRWGKGGMTPEELEVAGSNSYLTAEIIKV